MSPEKASDPQQGKAAEAKQTEAEASEAKQTEAKQAEAKQTEAAAKPKRARKASKAKAAEPQAGKGAEAEAKPAAKKAAAKKPARKAAKAAAPAEEKAAAPAAKGRRSGKASAKAPRRRVVSARARYVRTSARKARMVCGHIRGKSVQEARAILAFTTREVARDWSKLLESAVANAESNHELLEDDLIIREAYADEGPTIKRFRPRAMGRATPIRKRTSHLTIALIPRPEPGTNERKR
jgi:ribosomal protein L22